MNDRGLKLGVNIDHVATLRQARGTVYPDIVEAADICRNAGAHGITIHLREDRRHIQDRDVLRLKEFLEIPMNLEMAVAPEIVAIATRVKPSEVCLVPEKREELTTEGGLDVHGQSDAVTQAVATLSQAGSMVSLFIDPDPAQVEATAAAGAPCVELHTGTYCNALAAGQNEKAEQELERLIAAACQAHSLGIQVNAGHGLNLDNIGGCLRIPYLDTLNIGHSIIAHAVFVGLGRAVKAMLQALQAYRGGEHA